MANNEVRKDYLLNRWVVIAKERKKRPTDFVNNEIPKKNTECPLCPENEHMTPPAVLVYLPFDETIKKESDQDSFRYKDWVIRVVPNLFPAFSPSLERDYSISEDSTGLKAVGHHEVFIESPCHNEHPGAARVSQLVHLINAYLDRMMVLSQKTYVKNISLFRNHGSTAGASLSHAHTQLITTPFIPTILEEEIESSKSFWNKNHECRLCNVLQKEKKGPRFVWENRSFVVFAPWASINPLEFWVMPKKHNSDMLAMSSFEIEDLAETMRVSLGGLKTILNDPPYNYGFHNAVSKDVQDYYHWHLEVYPRLSIWAGFEKSTGMFINVISPEDAAIELKKAAEKEKSKLR
jgi:UDPglucose--hexose-1-phosphate uridylyltransferase